MDLALALISIWIQVLILIWILALDSALALAMAFAAGAATPHCGCPFASAQRLYRTMSAGWGTIGVDGCPALLDMV